jgi:SAM-dependent methyltransferase
VNPRARSPRPHGLDGPERHEEVADSFETKEQNPSRDVAGPGRRKPSRGRSIDLQERIGTADDQPLARLVDLEMVEHRPDQPEIVPACYDPGTMGVASQGIGPVTGRDPQDAYYRTRFSHAPEREKVWRVICRYLERYLPPRAVILDLGAGYCSFINQVRAAKKHALDVFPGFVEYAAADVGTCVSACSNLSSFGDGQLDVVFSSNLLEHLGRTEVLDTLAEVRRVVKPGGRVVIIQPNFRYCSREYFDDYTHQFVFSHVSLADLLASMGFHVDVVIPRFLPLTLKSRLPRWPWAVALYLRLPIRPLAKQMLLVATRQADE